MVFLLSSYLRYSYFSPLFALSQAWLWGDSVFCSELLEVLPSPAPSLPPPHFKRPQSSAAEAQCQMGPHCAANLCMSSVLGPLRQVFGNFLSFAFPFPSLNWVLICSFNFMQNWRTLWCSNTKSVAKCSCIFCTAAVDKAHKILCYFELQGKIMPTVHRLHPCYCECSFLTPWCSLQGRGTLSISLPHLTTSLLRPILSLSFPSPLHPAGFVPVTVCREADRALLLRWSKLKGTPFLRVIYTPDGCSSVVSSTAPSSTYQAVPGRESGSGWIGTSLVVLPCRRLSFVELLLPDRGMSKEFQCNKSGGSRGLAQWGLEEVAGQGEKNGKIGGNEGMKTQCI